MADVIRKINASTNNFRVLTRNLPTNAVLGGIDVSANGTVYAADFENHVVYKIFESGRVEGVMAGKLGVSGDILASTTNGGQGTDARFYRPFGICVDRSDNIYLVDRLNYKVKRLSNNGRVRILAGGSSSGDVVDDNGDNVRFSALLSGICVDNAGVVYVADTANHKIKKIYPSGRTTSLAGSTAGFANGLGSNAQFNAPFDVAVDAQGVVYVADLNNNRIRKITPDGTVTTLAGQTASGYVNGNGIDARFDAPSRLALDPSGRVLYVLDYNNGKVRRIDQDGTVTTFMDYSTSSGPGDITVDNTGFVYLMED